MIQEYSRERPRKKEQQNERNYWSSEGEDESLRHLENAANSVSKLEAELLDRSLDSPLLDGSGRHRRSSILGHWKRDSRILSSLRGLGRRHRRTTTSSESDHEEGYLPIPQFDEADPSEAQFARNSSLRSSKESYDGNPAEIPRPTSRQASERSDSSSVTKLRQPHAASDKYSKGLKRMQNQVCVTVIEARQLAGLNMDPIVCVQVGDQRKMTSSKGAAKSTNCPYYNEYFVFDFNMPTDLFLDQMITITVFHSKKLIGNSTVVGNFKLDVHTVYNQPDRQFYHKWAVISDPEDLAAGPKGYVKCDIAVTTRGEPAKPPPKIDKSTEDDIEANLLLPDGQKGDRQYAKYVLRIFKADGIPLGNSNIVSSVKKAFTSDVTYNVNPFVEVTFGGKKAKTKTCSGTITPEWNQQITFTETFPPLVRRVKIQIIDDALNNTIIATHYLDFSQISDETRTGFLPTYGPCWVNMYGALPDQGLLSDKMEALNTGIGEGVSYRGRLYLSFRAELATEPTKNTDIRIEETMPIIDSALGRMEDFLLFCCVMDTSMIDKRHANQPMTLEMSVGTYGLTDREATMEGGATGEENGEAATATTLLPPSWRSITRHARPITRDQAYCYIPFNEEKPCLYIRQHWPDQRRRMFNTNALLRLHELLEDCVSEVRLAFEKELPEAEQIFKDKIDHFVARCADYQEVSRGFMHQVAGQTKLDKERFRSCQRHIDRVCSAARNAKHTINSFNIKDKLKELCDFSDCIRDLTAEPQHSVPDVFLWLKVANRPLAYNRFAIHDLIDSDHELTRGKLCGDQLSFFLKTPGGKGTELSQMQAHVTAYMWFGLNRTKQGLLRGLTSGFELTKDLREIELPQSIPPPSITYTESYKYELRCHVFQARSLIGLDESGLSDPYVQLIFSGHSASSQVKPETLNPLWDETLVLSDIILCGNPTNIQASAPNIVMQVYDHDQVGKHEFLGQALAPCVVMTLGEVYEQPKFPPSLQWYPVFLKGERSGEILAAFELLQVPMDDQVTAKYPPLPVPNRQSPSGGPVRSVPEYVRPRLCRYRIEVLFWGLRDLKRLYLSTIDRPMVDVDIAGDTISSPAIDNYRRNPNFPAVNGTLTGVKEVELAENPLYWPPISIRVIDCKNFGRNTLIGVHTVNAIDRFIYKSPTAPETGSERSDEPQTFIVQVDGEPAIISADGAVASEPALRSRHVTARLQKARQQMRPPEKHKKEADEEDKLDWWSKYYASYEQLIQDDAHEGDEPLFALPGQPKKKRRFRISRKKIKKKLLEVTGGEAVDPFHRRSRTPNRADTLKIAKFKMYRNELEEEFEGFQDWLTTFDLYRGKQLAADDAESRYVGKFKGTLAVSKMPVPPDCSKTFFKHAPSNEPTSVLVRVYIVKAENLHPADVNGKADPYVVVQMGKTRISDKDNYVSKNLNPIFGKCFDAQIAFPLETQLLVQVYDWDLVGMDDLIGETRIDLEARFYSRHRGTCGLAAEFTSSGYNAWRDQLRPSQILVKMCRDYQLEGPYYAPGQVRVGGRSFTVPPEEGGNVTQNKVDSEALALYALHHWAEVPRVGVPLVPEHVESRSLYRPDKPGMEQGKIEMWVDMFPMDFGEPPEPVDIAPRKPVSYELRVVIWNTEDVVLNDDVFFTGEKMSDIYVKGWIKGPEDNQFTDVHYRSLTGEGNFNWRFIFPFDYLETEDKIVVTKKESILSWDETEHKLPARLNLQVWDADTISADDFLGCLVLDLTKFPRGAKSSKQCSLDLVSEKCKDDVPMVNIFKQRRVKGWWPFQAKSESGLVELTGKVEAELQLLTAEEAEKSPAGLGRSEPDPLERPNRPDTSFNFLFNPLKSVRYILWNNYRGMILKLVVLILVVLFLGLVIYSTPGYMVKRLLGA